MATSHNWLFLHGLSLVTIFSQRGKKSKSVFCVKQKVLFDFICKINSRFVKNTGCDLQKICFPKKEDLQRFTKRYKNLRFLVELSVVIYMANPLMPLIYDTLPTKLVDFIISKDFWLRCLTFTQGEKLVRQFFFTAKNTLITQFHSAKQ